MAEGRIADKATSREGGTEMRWGRILVLAFTGIVGLGLGLIVAEPWDGPSRVDGI